MKRLIIIRKILSFWKKLQKAPPLFRTYANGINEQNKNGVRRCNKISSKVRTFYAWKNFREIIHKKLANMRCYYPFLETFNNLGKGSTKKEWPCSKQSMIRTIYCDGRRDNKKTQKYKEKKKGWNWWTSMVTTLVPNMIFSFSYILVFGIDISFAFSKATLITIQLFVFFVSWTFWYQHYNNCFINTSLPIFQKCFKEIKDIKEIFNFFRKKKFKSFERKIHQCIPR